MIVWWSVEGVGVRSCYLCSQNVSGLRLDVEEETTACSDWIGCNFEPFRGHTFMTASKNDQFYDPPPPSHILCTTPCLDLQTWTIDLLFKNKKICRHVTNFKTNFWSLTCLLRMNCCLDTSPTGHFPNQDFPDWHIPDWTIPQPTLSQLGISLTRHLSEQLFPWLDVSPTGHFPERIFTRLHISPDTHFSFLYISFPSRHFLDAK